MGISKSIKKKAVVLIPLSGGLDSTFVAYQALKDGYTILPIYMTISNTNISKHTIERQQSKRIHSLLKKEFKSLVLDLQEFEGDRSNGVTQFDIWTNIIRNNVDLNSVNFIFLGPTKSDIDSCSMADMERRLEYANLSLENKVRFPALGFTKNDIGKILPIQYQEEVYTCEMPLYSKSHNDSINVDQCGVCNACHLHKMNKMTLAGPFKLNHKITDQEINENNQDHYKYIEYSNFYGQQDGVPQKQFALV